MGQQENHPNKGVTQSRGKELRDKMIQSEEFGENFRQANQGADVLETNIKHPQTPPSKTAKDKSLG